MTDDVKLLGALEAIVERMETAVRTLEKRVTALEASRAFVHGIVAAVSAFISGLVTWLTVRPHL